jgi:2,4-dienoyl-CoA reductase-like NADH-dependent reductase (Old Yellow Enzyme family)
MLDSNFFLLQSKTNHRKDDYGGSLENKYRFLKEFVEAVSTVYPLDRIGVRLSPNGSSCDMGHPDNHETFSYVIAELEKFHLGYLHIIDGLGFGIFHNLCKQFTLFDARKAGYTGLLMGNSGYTKDTANGAIGTGCCDMIAFGRPYMSNPDLVERFANDWPLADVAESKNWWSAPYENCAVGYTDYPSYTPPNSPMDKIEEIHITYSDY